MYYESLTEEIRQREAEKRRYFTINNFEAEINSMTTESQVLRSFIRYSNHCYNKEKLATLVINKLQELPES